MGRFGLFMIVLILLSTLGALTALAAEHKGYMVMPGESYGNKKKPFLVWFMYGFIFCGIPIIFLMKRPQNEVKPQQQSSPRPAPQQWTPYVEQKQFNGIYRVSALTGKKTPIYCPRCNSDRCRWYTNTIHQDARTKTKTRYTVNLNPLRPFTLYNKKEKTKIIAPERNIEERKIQCENCGYTFF